MVLGALAAFGGAGFSGYVIRGLVPGLLYTNEPHLPSPDIKKFLGETSTVTDPGTEHSIWTVKRIDYGPGEKYKGFLMVPKKECGEAINVWVCYGMARSTSLDWVKVLEGSLSKSRKLNHAFLKHHAFLLLDFPGDGSNPYQKPRDVTEEMVYNSTFEAIKYVNNHKLNLFRRSRSGTEIRRAIQEGDKELEATIQLEKSMIQAEKKEPGRRWTKDELEKMLAEGDWKLALLNKLFGETDVTFSGIGHSRGCAAILDYQKRAVESKITTPLFRHIVLFAPWTSLRDIVSDFVRTGLTLTACDSWAWFNSRPWFHLPRYCSSWDNRKALDTIVTNQKTTETDITILHGKYENICGTWMGEDLNQIVQAANQIVQAAGSDSKVTSEFRICDEMDHTSILTEDKILFELIERSDDKQGEDRTRGVIN